MKTTFFITVCCLTLSLFSSSLHAQEQITDQVAVTVFRDQIVAATSGETISHVTLDAGEQVLASEARGLNALVMTTSRILAFSSQMGRWAEQKLSLYDRVVERKVTSRLIIVRADKKIYAYQASSGRWQIEDFAVGEDPRTLLVGENIAVMITTRRALGFSALIGGFFAQDIMSEEPVTDSSVNDNIAILSLPTRRLIFRSQFGHWKEIR